MIFLGLHFTWYAITVLSLFVLSLAVLLFYYGFVFLRVGLHKDKQAVKEKKEPVSVIICVKDEYFKLKENLFYLLEQEYPQYEVIVVNCASQDETEFLLKVFSETYPHLKIVNLQSDVNGFSGKKFPLSIGIKSAKYDLILHTNADYLPSSYKWIDKMQSQFESKTQILLGYSSIKPQQSLLGFLVQYDNVVSMASCLGFALAKNPYTGFGENMAYRRSFFFQNKGFINHYYLAFGEDSLFVNQNANASNTQICLDKETYTISSEKVRFSEWIVSKMKRFSAVKKYKQKHRILLSLYPFSIVLFYAAFCGLLLLNFDIRVLLSCLLVKLGFQIFSCYKLKARLNAPKKISFLSPVFELFFVFFNAIISIFALKPYKG